MNHRIAALALLLALLLTMPALGAEAAPETGAAPQEEPAPGTFVRTKTYEGQFSDLSQDSPFYENVAALYEYGLTLGRPDGTYGPGDPMTVGEIIIFAGRIRSLYRTGSAEAGPDAYRAGPEAAALRYLRYLKAEEVLDAALDRRLEENASRAEVAHVLAKLLPEEALPPINDRVVAEGYGRRQFIQDVKSATPYYQDILTLYRLGVSGGSGPRGSFQPEEDVTRGAAAAMLTRLVDPALRVTLTWDVSGPATASWATLTNIVPKGEDIPYPKTDEEIELAVQHMLSTGSDTMHLHCPGITGAEMQALKNKAFYIVESYSEQCYRGVTMRYNPAGDVDITFTSAGEPELVNTYRSYTMSAAIELHDYMWDKGHITADMSEYDRARVYYTWICQNCRYDDNVTGGGVTHMPYTLFERGVAVCDGYTGALNLLLKLEGIECTGLAYDGHIWTVATLDGTEVHIDVTWGALKSPSVDYKFFAMTPEQSAEHHPWQ